MPEKINFEALNNLSYGVYVLCAREGYKDNGCIVNTAMLVSETPYRMLVSVNKNNYTHDMIKATGKLNVSVLNDNTSLEMIKRFGFVSGRDVDKLDGFDGWERADNDIIYVTENANACISGKVYQEVDAGTHTVFFCDITESIKIDASASLTYSEYHKNVKPKHSKAVTEKKKYVCTICGYEYEGEELPEDFICPWCKHGADAFELVK